MKPEYKPTLSICSNEFSEFLFSFEADQLFNMARVYKSKNLKKAKISELFKERKILQDRFRMLQNIARDYAFSGNENSHPDYEKALVYGNIALNEIEESIIYHWGGFE